MSSISIEDYAHSNPFIGTMDANIVSTYCANAITAGYISAPYSKRPVSLWRDHLENFIYAVIVESQLELSVTIGALVLIHHYQYHLSHTDRSVAIDVEDAVRLFVAAYMVAARLATDDEDADVSMEHWEDITFQEYTVDDLANMERSFHETLERNIRINSDDFEIVHSELIDGYKTILGEKQRAKHERWLRKERKLLDAKTTFVLPIQAVVRTQPPRATPSPEPMSSSGSDFVLRVVNVPQSTPAMADQHSSGWENIVLTAPRLEENAPRVQSPKPLSQRLYIIRSFRDMWLPSGSVLYI